jgi:hypothetical protein
LTKQGEDKFIKKSYMELLLFKLSSKLGNRLGRHGAGESDSAVDASG